MNYSLVNVEDWCRKEQFHFFKTFDEPFTGVVVEVNVTKAYKHAKSKNVSFFQWYLHKCVTAANQTEAFRLRIVDEEVRKYDKIHASAVMLRSDGSFGFSNIPFDEEFTEFATSVRSEKQRIENNHQLFPPENPPNTLHISAMPWIKFTGLSHARKYHQGDTCPKISFGKMFSENDKLKMPVSIHVHHALVDGRDIGAFIELFEQRLQEN